MLTLSLASARQQSAQYNSLLSTSWVFNCLEKYASLLLAAAVGHPVLARQSRHRDPAHRFTQAARDFRQTAGILVVGDRLAIAFARAAGFPP